MEYRKVIYDFGANNGDDIPYYLLKADKVVAVEANPALAAQIATRFSQDIVAQKLVVEHCALTVDDDDGVVPFYIHKSTHVLSQLPRPDRQIIDQFDEILIASRNVTSLIIKHDAPFYIKTDLENYDSFILMELFRQNIRPNFVSAESHSIDVFALLVSLGYTSFNLVDGATVRDQYSNCPVMTENGRLSYTFPHHSAGPFGVDIKGPWMTPNNFFRRLAFEQLGWKDIHATNEIAADPTVGAYVGRFLRDEMMLQSKDMLRRHAPAVFNTLKSLRSHKVFNRSA